MKRNILWGGCLILLMPLLLSFHVAVTNSNKEVVEYDYIFKIEGVNNPGDAKNVNVDLVIPYFQKIAIFNDELDKFEVVTPLSFNEDNFQSFCTTKGYVLLEFEMHIIG